MQPVMIRSVSSKFNGRANLERVYITKITLDDENILTSPNLCSDLVLGSRLVSNNSEDNVI